MSEYDPVLPLRPISRDREQVEALFAEAAAPYLRSPWSWFTWSLVLPLTAASTRVVAARFGPAGVLLLWSVAILAAGLVETVPHLRRRRSGTSALATWAMRGQANLSLVGVAASAALVWLDAAWLLPGLWLLILGHSFYLLGGLAFRPLRTAGLWLQAGGLLAFWPRYDPLLIFAVTTAIGNLFVGVSVLRARREARAAPS